MSVDVCEKCCEWVHDCKDMSPLSIADSYPKMMMRCGTAPTGGAGTASSACSGCMRGCSNACRERTGTDLHE